MNWRWISFAAVLAAILIAYGAFNGRPQAPVAARPPAQPGYYLNDAVVSEMQEDGALGLRLTARRIEEVAPPEGGIVARDVRVDYFRARGAEWRLTAQQAFSPANSRVVHFKGDVELRPSDAEGDAFLRTQSLTLDTTRNVARANEAPVELMFGAHRLIVQDFTADLNTEELRMESVRGVYQPR